MALGVYPETTLAKASATHQAARNQLSAGTDPMETRKTEGQGDVLTFQAVAEKWREHWKAGKTEKHNAEVWRRLQIDIFPAIGKQPVSDLTATVVRKAVKADAYSGEDDRWFRSIVTAAHSMMLRVQIV